MGIAHHTLEKPECGAEVLGFLEGESWWAMPTLQESDDFAFPFTRYDLLSVRKIMSAKSSGSSGFFAAPKGRPSVARGANPGKSNVIAHSYPGSAGGRGAGGGGGWRIEVLPGARSTPYA